MKKNIIFALALLVVAGCDTAGDNTSFSGKAYESDSGTAFAGEIDLQRLTKKADISFQTRNVEKTYDIIRDTLNDFDATITEDHSFNYSTRTGYEMTIRVPAENFEGFVGFITESSVIRTLDNKTISVSDVTEETIDIRARLKIKKETELRITELLKQAKTITEILEIQKQLSDLRAEIESIEGRMNYLTDQTDFSTVTLSFYENAKYSKRFFSDFWDALKEGWQVFLHLLTMLAYMWVIILVVLGIVWGIKLNGRRKRKSERNIK